MRVVYVQTVNGKDKIKGNWKTPKTDNTYTCMLSAVGRRTLGLMTCGLLTGAPARVTDEFVHEKERTTHFVRESHEITLEKGLLLSGHAPMPGCRAFRNIPEAPARESSSRGNVVLCLGRRHNWYALTKTKDPALSFIPKFSDSEHHLDLVKLGLRLNVTGATDRQTLRMPFSSFPILVSRRERVARRQEELRRKTNETAKVQKRRTTQRPP